MACGSCSKSDTGAEVGRRMLMAGVRTAVRGRQPQAVRGGTGVGCSARGACAPSTSIYNDLADRNRGGP